MPKGDVNFDDQINILDVVLMVQHIVGNIELSPAAIEIGDMNNDSIIDIFDVISVVNLIINTPEPTIEPITIFEKLI